MSVCGCAACGREFTTLAAFDKHQDADYGRSPAITCLDPASRGLEQNRRGRWHVPQTDAGRLRLAKLTARQDEHADA
jgi:hypothetical protein